MRGSYSFVAVIALAGCNAIFGIEPGEPIGAGSGAAGAGGEGGAGEGGGGAGSVGEGGGGAGSAGEGGGAGGPSTCGTGGGGPFTGALRWAAQSAASSNAMATAVAWGGNNDVIAAGVYSEGHLQIGRDVLEYPHGTGFDMFLTSLDEASGRPRWAVGFSGENTQEPSAVKVAAGSGDIVLTGWYDGAFSFNAGEQLVAQDQDAFVARLTREGALRWSRRIGGAGQHMGLNVAVDGDEAVVVALYIDGPVAFAGETFGNVDERGVFLGKLDAQGNELWGRYEPIWFDPGIPLGLDVDAAGNIALTGPTDRHAFRSTDEHRGAFDVFVVKLDPSGKPIWSRIFGGTAAVHTENGMQRGTAVAIDCSGAVYVTGTFQKDLVLGSLPVLTNVAPAAEEDDMFVARLSADRGEPEWARALGDTGVQLSASIGADRGSNVVIGGTLVDDAASTGIDFGGGMKHGTSLPDGTAYQPDFFAAKYAPDGEYLWSTRVGDEFIQEGTVAVDPSGAVAAAGNFFFSMRFGDTPDGVLSSERRDLFVTVLEP
ncbi:hypothetical protein WME76_23590 [Sorangium sp. So ce119]|uniref:hypothetical protein n=1 Tax=Sorangium sp. So ce119 TaxID=3133279 RepID=UPI003F61A2F5